MKTFGIFLIILINALSSIGQTREQGPWWPSPLWGPKDEAGASNWITADKILKALKYAKEGKVYELGHPYERVMPFVGTRSFKLNVVDTGPPPVPIVSWAMRKSFQVNSARSERNSMDPGISAH